MSGPVILIVIFVCVYMHIKIISIIMLDNVFVL